MTSESEVTPQILQAMQASGCQLYRNNRGATKFGTRWVRYGVGPNGAADFVGFMSIVVTPEMVGHRLAVFCTPETKRPNAVTDPDHLKRQFEWRNTVRAAGGIAGFVHSWEEGRDLVMNFWARFKRNTRPAKS